MTPTGASNPQSHINAQGPVLGGPPGLRGRAHRAFVASGRRWREGDDVQRGGAAPRSPERTRSGLFPSTTQGLLDDALMLMAGLMPRCAYGVVLLVVDQSPPQVSHRETDNGALRLSGDAIHQHPVALC